MKKKKENRLVVGDAAWAADIPEWLLDEVRTERIVLGLVSIMNPDMQTVGDAEVAVYLFTAAMRAPLPHDYFEIYMYLTTRLMEKREIEVPADIRQDKLSRDSERELRDLRHKIYRLRGGEIAHPLLDAMRVLKKTCDKEAKKEEKDKKKLGGLLFED